MNNESPRPWWITAAMACCVLTLTPSALGQFAAQNVTLHDWLDLTPTELNAVSGNDCWGYVSPSGREYALMGLNNKLTIVEITTPGAPVIVGNITHTNSTWADVKVFDQYCYVVNESGGGMDVVDLTNIDAATNRIGLVQRITTGGLSTSHNVAINTDSGYLYLIGSNLNGGAPVVYDLVDPANPVEVGRWTEPQAAMHHDAHIVTYTAGPYAGREIEFGFSEGRGVDILDVTDKSNIFMLSRTTYPNLAYCHQGWTTPDRRYLYINDELDEGNFGVTTRTIIFDIADLNAPIFVGTYTNGLQSIDHNLYIQDCIMYQANYSSGLRILSISDPLNPVEVGFFDTYPENDGGGFFGIWSLYHQYPSGTVIASDFERGLFILDPGPAIAAANAVGGSLDLTFPTQPPTVIDPLGGSNVTMDVTGRCGASFAPGSAQFHYDLGNGFTSVAMTETSPDRFEAVFPITLCTQNVPYYFSALTDGGSSSTAPDGAPGTTFSATSTGPLSVIWQDDFETDQGWVTGPDTAATGTFLRGDPVGTGAQPEDDHTDIGVNCLYTAQNPAASLGTDDVDAGTVVVTSPTFDLSDGDALVSYYRWYFERDLNDDPADGYLAEISNNNGTSWTPIESLSPGPGGWELVQFSVSDFLAPTAQMQLRFSATDGTTDGDIIEAAIDDVVVFRYTCPLQTTDLNNDGRTDLRDYAQFQTCHTGTGPCPCLPTLYGPTDQSPCVSADIDLDGDIDDADLANLAAGLVGP